MTTRVLKSFGPLAFADEYSNVEEQSSTKTQTQSAVELGNRKRVGTMTKRRVTVKHVLGNSEAYETFMQHLISGLSPLLHPFFRMHPMRGKPT